MSTSWQTLGNFLNALIDGGNADHGFLVRLSTAVWGSLVMHLAMLARNSSLVSATPDIPIEIFAALAAICLIYCAVFGLVVAVGVTRGSLVRHFCFGAILPAFAYSLARVAAI